jgi:hypothetical protein
MPVAAGSASLPHHSAHHLLAEDCQTALTKWRPITVRRMTDVNIKLAPLSVVSPHFGYFQNVNQGPTNSTLHVGADALLTQNWRVSTDAWNAGIDWKPLARTTISYDQFFTHYKGNTSWQLTGLDYKLSDCTPVSLGIDISSVLTAVITRRTARASITTVRYATICWPSTK